MGSIDDVVWHSVSRPNRPNARHYQGLLGRCRVITLLRVIAAGGWDDASLARWLLVAAFGRTVPLAFLTGVTLYLVFDNVLEGRYTKDCDWREQRLH